MLKRLEILNVALIDKLVIDFSSNLNVLSGETGAGKSIVIDALNFVIGAKASKTLPSTWLKPMASIRKETEITMIG